MLDLSKFEELKSPLGEPLINDPATNFSTSKEEVNPSRGEKLPNHKFPIRTNQHRHFKCSLYDMWALEIKENSEENLIINS